jgi:hypothetical protein
MGVISSPRSALSIYIDPKCWSIHSSHLARVATRSFAAHSRA